MKEWASVTPDWSRRLERSSGHSEKRGNLLSCAAVDIEIHE